MDRDIAKDTTKKYVAELVSEWMVGSDPSDFTQGLMELGALICKVSTPECAQCPINQHCLAYHSGKQNEYPVKSSSKKPVLESYIVHIVLDNDQLLVSSDWSDGLMEGYMRLPQVESNSQYFDVDESLFSHKHVFSHKIWELSVVKSRIDPGAKLPSYWKWIPLAEVDSQPWISAHRKILVKYLKKSDLASL